jgi:hypothetical protein
VLLNFILLDRYMPMNDVKPANVVNVMVLSMSVVHTLEDATANTEYLCIVNKNCERKNIAVCKPKGFMDFFRHVLVYD